MENQEFQIYLIPVLIVFFVGWRFFKSRKMKARLPQLLREGAMIIDVRSPAEYATGHNPVSQNIPLDQLPARLKDIPKDKPLILCCASGTRSGMAALLLKKNGYLQVTNAGAWSNTII